MDISSEQAVLCPFPHKLAASDEPYFETRPSAHVDASKGLFHCKACGLGFNEIQFIEEIFGCSRITAIRVKRAFETERTLEAFLAVATPLSEETAARARSLGISDTAINFTNMRNGRDLNKTVMAFPVEMYGTHLDTREYDPGNTPKVKSMSGAISGLILPFKNLQDTKENEWITICAGEKDMCLALSHGLKAITITGGEMALPVCPKLFTNRKVAILYDNDDTGRRGATRVATELYRFTKHIKVVTNFHEVCKEKGEDLTDFFTKYNGTIKQLRDFVNATPWFVPAPSEKDKPLAVMNLYNATQPENLGKLVKTLIQVVGVEDRAFSCPKTFYGEKIKQGQAPLKNLIAVGDMREWKLDEDNIEDLLYLVDDSYTEEKIHENQKIKLLRYPAGEEYITIKNLSYTTVYSAAVIDAYESGTDSIKPIEFSAMILGQQLESGKKYLVTHKMCPHPKYGQQLTMVITNIEASNDSISTFKVDEHTKAHLQAFQGKSYKEIAEKMKANIGFDVHSPLLHTIDLSYHTPLMFHFNKRNQNLRATLDTLVISESRVGKSSTAKALQETYGLGMFVSLAGNAATIAGLVGGSSKVGGGNNYQTRAGIIPQNHKGLLVLEELGKANNDLMKELTDVRSSSKVRITRVSGSVELPAMLRMIALTNPKSKGNTPQPISAYPNGIAIVTELVAAPEDIARYDLIHIVSDAGADHIDPMWVPEEAFTQEQYQTRIKWIWSRTPEQIIIDPEVQRFVIERSNALNSVYGAHIKIFGTETWKKLCRIAIAIAGYTVSTDESYENIIVKKTHINDAINLFVALYDNHIFRLKEFCAEEKQYTVTDNDAIATLQDIYIKCPAIIHALNTVPRASQATLSASTGLDRPVLAQILRRLVQAYFVKFEDNDVVPTARYRKTAQSLDRNVHVDRVGEGQVTLGEAEVDDDDF